MKPHQIEALEISLLLEAIYQRYGYDFRNYAAASIQRRITRFLMSSGRPSISALIPEVIHDPSFFQQLLLGLSITVTEMFRDPLMFRSLRETVLPFMKSFPSFKIWHAGCATGQEAYSLSIVLEEEGLNHRATIYATDFNDEALDVARKGIYEKEHIEQYSENYVVSGGKRSFADYYHEKYDAVIMRKSLKERIIFANHNLATDSVFSEIHLIFCRNVLIYFDRELQKKVLNLFWDCLPYNGFLCLGTRESLAFSGLEDKFMPVDKKYKIFQKKEIQ